MAIKVRLTRAEMATCKQLASGRSQISRLSGVPNARRDQERSDFQIDFLGVKSEMAVSKLFQADHSFYLMGVDDGTDLYIDDCGIDVKSTFHKHGKMLFKSLDAFRADVCILATADDQDNVISVVGWMGRRQWRATAQPFRANGYSTGMALEQDALHQIKDLWEALAIKRYGGDKR